jgi:hypothetical protein
MIFDFDNANSGPEQLEDDMTALHFFELFMGNDVMQLLVDETNRYATQEHAKVKEEGKPHQLALDPVTMDEMKAFLGLHMVMGINRLPQMEM